MSELAEMSKNSELAEAFDTSEFAEVKQGARQENRNQGTSRNKSNKQTGHEKEKGGFNGLHTLHIAAESTPQDIHRNLLQPIEESAADNGETRTGDTPSHKRQRQRKKPPNILLTTRIAHADVELRRCR